MCDLGSGSEEAWSYSPAAASGECGATAICTDQGSCGAYIHVTPDSENPLAMSVGDYLGSCTVLRSIQVGIY